MQSKGEMAIDRWMDREIIDRWMDTGCLNGMRWDG